MDKEVFFDTIKDELFFKFRVFKNMAEDKEVLRIKTKGDCYYLAAYVRKEDILQDNSLLIKKMSFDEYSDIVFKSKDTYGVAINVDGEYILYDHLYLRELRVNQNWEEFISDLNERCVEEEIKEAQIKEYHQKNYNNNLKDAKIMWNLGSYEKAFDILYFGGSVWPQNAGESFYYCAMICEKIENLSMAEQLYRRAVKEEEYNYWLYYRLAQFYCRIGRNDLETEVYERAYIHHRFNNRNQDQLKNDGIQYVLKELIQCEGMKKKRIQKIAYRKYATEIDKKYKNLPECRMYNYLSE